MYKISSMSLLVPKLGIPSAISISLNTSLAIKVDAKHNILNLDGISGFL